MPAQHRASVRLCRTLSLLRVANGSTTADVMAPVRLFAALGVVAALWGMFFAAVSSADYASHLDRGLHDLHCSFIPGVSNAGAGEGCRVALNSPYAAMFKTQLWGGIPISLFGLGCFAFLAGFAAFILVKGTRTQNGTGWLYALVACSPAVVSAVMFAISWFELGTICKTCAGIYIGSGLLAVSGIGVGMATRHNRQAFSWSAALATMTVLFAMLIWTLAPSLVYAAWAPDHAPFVAQCGQIKQPKEAHGALLAMRGLNPKRSALFFEDPLCPTCKSLHERLALAGALARLDAQLALFPLDTECNWMLDQSLHPGACQLSRALLCAKSPADMLEWTYANQEKLAQAGKLSTQALTALVTERWGADIARCMSDRNTTQALNRHLHFAADNAIAVSTPQVFIDGQRLCDEDIDIGLMFALKRLAPELLQ
jgi:uncharacterized membrane protein